MDDLARMGFDVVTACHSHRISGYKEVRRPNASSAFCFYGLGSISSAVVYSDLEREGLVVVVGIDHSGSPVRIEVQPVQLAPTGWGRIPPLGDAYRTLDRFLLLSEEIARGSYKQRFYADVRSDLLRRQFRDVQAAFENGGLRGLASKLGRVRMRHLSRALHRGTG